MPMTSDGMDPPLIEPRLVDCLFATGAAVETTNGVVRIIAWVHTPNLGGETEERRIIARLAFTEGGAKQLGQDLSARDFSHDQ